MMYFDIMRNFSHELSSKRWINIVHSPFVVFSIIAHQPKHSAVHQYPLGKQKRLFPRRQTRPRNSLFALFPQKDEVTNKNDKQHIQQRMHVFSAAF